MEHNMKVAVGAITALYKVYVPWTEDRAERVAAALQGNQKHWDNLYSKVCQCFMLSDRHLDNLRSVLGAGVLEHIVSEATHVTVENMTPSEQEEVAKYHEGFVDALYHFEDAVSMIGEKFSEVC